MTRTLRPRPWVSAFGALALLVTACGGTATPGGSSAGGAGGASPAAAGGGSPAASGAAAWSRASEGTSLSMIAEATLNSQVLESLLPDFTAKTGIDVQLEQAPYDSVVQKLTLNATTKQGAYDIVSLPYEFLGAFAEKGWITPIDDRLADKGSYGPGFDPSAIIPALWKASSVWRDKTYGMPSNSAVMMMFYRKDLFENAAEQAAFKAKYGYDLAVPSTWKQYRDAAEFFTRKAGSQLAGANLSKDFAGVAMTGKRHVATVLEWLDYGWTYGGGILDPQGNLIIDSQPSVDSLGYMAGLRPFAQPGYTNATWDETTATLQQGGAALSITWGDTAGAMEATDQSAVVGKMGYASIPTLNDAGDRPSRQLDLRDPVREHEAGRRLGVHAVGPVGARPDGLGEGRWAPGPDVVLRGPRARQLPALLEAGAREPRPVEEPTAHPRVGVDVGHPPEGHLGCDLRPGDARGRLQAGGRSAEEGPDAPGRLPVAVVRRAPRGPLLRPRGATLAASLRSVPIWSSA